jgi:hypothetical protein
MPHAASLPLAAFAATFGFALAIASVLWLALPGLPALFAAEREYVVLALAVLTTLSLTTVLSLLSVAAQR